MELTFNVREVKIFLHWCAWMDVDVSVLFSVTGAPMLFESAAHHPPIDLPAGAADAAATAVEPIKMELVVATLAESHTQSATPQPSPVQHVQPSQSAASQLSASQQQHAVSQAFLQKQSAAMSGSSGADDYAPRTP